MGEGKQTVHKTHCINFPKHVHKRQASEISLNLTAVGTRGASAAAGAAAAAIAARPTKLVADPVYPF